MELYRAHKHMEINPDLSSEKISTRESFVKEKDKHDE